MVAKQQYKLFSGLLLIIMGSFLLVGCGGGNNDNGQAWVNAAEPGSNWEINGVVDSISTDGWIVQGHKIYNPGNTVIIGAITPGLPAIFKGHTTDTRILIAVEVVVNISATLSSEPTALPTVNPIPTVTPMPSQTANTSPTVTVAATATRASTATPAPTLTPAPTATPKVVSPVQTEGVIQNIIVNNNVTVVVINNIQYIVPASQITLLGPSLKVGIYLKLNANRLSDGTIVIVNVVVNNNNAAPVVKGGDDNEDEDGNSQGKKQKDSPADHDNGKGNDGKKHGK